MLINLEKKPDIIKKNVARCKERGITLPTFEEMKHPEKISDDIKAKLKERGLWDVDPVNLYRITWHNEPVEKGGGFKDVNFITNLDVTKHSSATALMHNALNKLRKIGVFYSNK